MAQDTDIVRDKCVVVVIDFHLTKVHVTDATPEVRPKHIVAVDPRGHFHEVHHRAGNPDGTYEADDPEYWQQVTKAVAPAGCHPRVRARQRKSQRVSPLGRRRRKTPRRCCREDRCRGVCRLRRGRAQRLMSGSRTSAPRFPASPATLLLCVSPLRARTHTAKRDRQHQIRHSEPDHDGLSSSWQLTAWPWLRREPGHARRGARIEVAGAVWGAGLGWHLRQDFGRDRGCHAPVGPHRRAGGRRRGRPGAGAVGAS